MMSASSKPASRSRDHVNVDDGTVVLFLGLGETSPKAAVNFPRVLLEDERALQGAVQPAGSCALFRLVREAHGRDERVRRE